VPVDNAILSTPATDYINKNRIGKNLEEIKEVLESKEDFSEVARFNRESLPNKNYQLNGLKKKEGPTQNTPVQIFPINNSKAKVNNFGINSPEKVTNSVKNIGNVSALRPKKPETFEYVKDGFSLKND